MRRNFFLIIISVLFVTPVFSQADISPGFVFSLHDNIVNDNRFAECIDTDVPTALPFGIAKEIGASKYIIAIDSASFFPAATSLRAFMALDFPQSSERIAFAAQNIQFNPKGVASSSFSRLLLVSKHKISVGPKVSMVIEPNGRNYVEWDCNGYKAVNLSGYFEFDNSMLIPDTEVSGDSVVRASFEIYTQDIHNFIAQVSISPFKLKGLNDFSFSVLDATVDMSELLNAPGMVFPAGYANVSTAEIQSWTGFFMRQLKITLPPELSKSGRRVEVYAENFLLDNIGVSGNFGVNNLLSIQEGSMNGWGFSVDNINISIVANKLNGGGMAGSVVLPIAKDNPLIYSAAVFYNPVVEQADYVFTINAKNNISVPAFSANIDVYNTSRIIVKKQMGRFMPEAVLNGKITMDNETAAVKGISFEQLVLITEEPYLTNGVFGLVSSQPFNENRIAQFPITINDFFLFVNPISPAIGFNVALNFMDKDDSGFSGATRVRVVAKVDNSNWEFAGVVVDSIALSARTNFFKLEGVVRLHNNDPIYGSGFFGNIFMQFDKFIESPVSVSACFGKKEDYRYWFVNASVPIKIPLGSGLSIYRLMGGLRYHMRQTQEAQLPSILYSSTASSVTYYPDNTAGLAFIAGVTLAPDVNDKTLNGDVAFEIAFNSNGGLGNVKLAGTVFSMISINERLTKPVTSIPIRATMLMCYDNSNKSFHSVLDVFINTNGITGAGQCVVHFDPDIRYICIGKPSTRFTVSLANIAAVQAYFMMGNQLEPMPPVPSKVQSIVGSNGLDNLRNQEQLTTGKGFVFGAAINASSYKEFSLTDNISVYGGFGMAIGFDMMLLDYGKNAYCRGTTVKPGIDGWYTSGQVYAAMDANVGVKGTILRQDFNVTVLSGSVAAVLYAQLPRPYYFQGQVGCQYEILSLLKGNFNFDFSLGSYCSVVN